MRKICVFIIGIIIPMLAAAQNDWANYNRYAEANAQVTASPKAVLMGDSITAGWPSADPEFFSDNNFVGRGISGQVTSQMLLRFRQDVIDLHPKYVVILAGTNDIAENSVMSDMEKTFGNIVSMCDLAKANGIKPIICSVIPASSFKWRPSVTGAAEKIVKLNAMLEKYAKENRIKYVDYHSSMKDERGGLPESLAKDGVHPTREGYDIMKNLLLKAL